MIGPISDDRRDRANGDDANQQAVFDQVLALFVANQLHEKLLHGVVSNVNAFFTKVSLAAALVSASRLGVDSVHARVNHVQP